MKNLKQSSVVLGRDSMFDANLSIEEEDAIPGIIGMSVHRCSMIKKYNIETFFSPAKHHRRVVSTNTKPIMPITGACRPQLQAVNKNNNEQLKTLQPFLVQSKWHFYLN